MTLLAHAQNGHSTPNLHAFGRLRPIPSGQLQIHSFHRNTLGLGLALQ
jgi:hypothetical protein